MPTKTSYMSLKNGAQFKFVPYVLCLETYVDSVDEHLCLKLQCQNSISCKHIYIVHLRKSHYLAKSSSCSASSPTLGIVSILYFSHVDRCVVKSHPGFTLYFPNGMMVNIFSCAYLPSVYPLWCSVCSNLFIFIFCFFLFLPFFLFYYFYFSNFFWFIFKLSSFLTVELRVCVLWIQVCWQWCALQHFLLVCVSPLNWFS